MAFIEVYVLSCVLRRMSWSLELLCSRPLEKLKGMVSGMGIAAAVISLELNTGPEFPCVAEHGLFCTI